MTSTAHSAGPPRATRSPEDRFLGGVAAGLGEHLGIDPMPVRIGFLVASLFGGFGVVLYLALWMVLPAGTHLDDSAPGLGAATRQGKRQGRTRRLEDVGPLVAIAVVGVGILVLAHGWIGGSILFWPVLLAVLGIVVLWRQADDAQRERWVDASGRVDLLRALVGRGGAASYARLAGGVVLVLAAIVLFALQTGQPGALMDVLIAGVLGILGLALMVGPWLFRLAGDLSEERAARIRSEERADMAAHLHDSVLQTLALIQKQANDPRAVTRLARSQERELRTWLYDEDDKTDQTLSGAAKRAAAEVEDSHGVPVEVVTVGDCELSEPLSSMVRAARESMVNAAKHSGAEKIDVFVEVDGDRAEIFVRDRGKGFDVDGVPDDRLGLRHSVMGRMERHGGRATVRSDPETGTEVRLEMDR